MLKMKQTMYTNDYLNIFIYLSNIKLFSYSLTSHGGRCSGVGGGGAEGYKIRTNTAGETKEDMMPALVKQQKDNDIQRMQSYKSNIYSNIYGLYYNVHHDVY